MTVRSRLRLSLVVLGSIALSAVLPAAAKEFAPGDLRACGATRCVAITDAQDLDAFSSFYYGATPVKRARAPHTGTRAFTVKFRDGTSAGLVGGRRLDRTRVYGLNCGRFHRGAWYALPPRVAQALRTLTQNLRPVRVTRTAPRSC